MLNNYNFRGNKSTDQQILQLAAAVKKTEHNQLIRKKQFNEVDFLSFVGGLFGLFVGFSSLSFVEIIYWISRKLFSFIKCKKLRRVYPTLNPEISSNQQNKNVLKEYFNESSIHGISYLFSANRLEG